MPWALLVLNRDRLTLSQSMMVRTLLDSSPSSPLLRTAQPLPELPRCKHGLVQGIEGRAFSP